MTETARPGIALYHQMRRHESFESTAEKIVKIIHNAQERFPDEPRYLYVDIEGHRNAAGGFDDDAWELIHHFGTQAFFPYVTEYRHPLLAVRNERQKNDPPEFVRWETSTDRNEQGKLTIFELPEDSVFRGSDA